MIRSDNVFLKASSVMMITPLADRIFIRLISMITIIAGENI
jgi:hypothetical protein